MPAEATDAGRDEDAGTEGGLRKVARVVLLDPRTASCCCTATSRRIPPTTGGSRPGGGVEGDETREEAALRELAEETGITEVELGPVLWRRMCSFPFAGRRWDQDEWYYLARTRADRDRPAAAHRTGAAQRRRSALVDVSGTGRGT